MTREGDIVSGILEAYKDHPRIHLWRQNSGVARVHGSHVRFGRAGAADITGIMDGGRRIEIECKMRYKKQHSAQILFQAMIERAGGLYVLAYSVGDVREVLG